MRKSLLSTMALVGASALMLASCAMPADDPNYAGGNDLSGGDPSAMASASAALDAAMVAPTSIGIDAALPGAPKAGATIISVVANTDLDDQLGAAMDDAAKALGWKHETVVVDLADPAAADAAVGKAIAAKPDGIHISGAFAGSLVESLAAAESAGIPIVCTGCSGEPMGAIKDTSINGDADNATWADSLATYVVKNQFAGEASAVQVFALPGQAMDSFNSSFDASLVGQCRECSSTQSLVDPTMLDITDPAAFAEFAVSELSTALGGWMLLDSGAISAGVAENVALDPTLLSPMIVLGRGAAATDLEALKALGGAAAPAASGEAAPAEGEAVEGEGATRTPEQAAALQAWVGISVPIEGWRVMDQFARILGGGEIAVAPLTSQFLTGANAADAVVDAKGNYLGVADYQEQFKALWGVK